MKRQKITPAVITSGALLTAAKRAKGGRVEIRDSESKLVLRVTANGTRSFITRPRLHDQSIRMTFPLPASPDTYKDARAWAESAAEQCALGIDPREEQKRQQQEEKEARAETFEVVLERYVAGYAKPRQKRWKETERTLRVNCAPWMDKSFTSITTKDANQLLDGFLADGHGRKAEITLSWIKTLWRWAWRKDIVEFPIMDKVQVSFEPQVRDRTYNDDETGSLWRGADSLSPIQGGFVKLLLLLGVRKNELAGMRRSEIIYPDDAAYPDQWKGANAPAVWIVPHERTKSKKTAKRRTVYIVPLPPLALRIIKGLPRLDPDLIFPGRHHRKPLDPGTPLKLKVQEVSSVDDWTYHPCRDTLATWLQNQGHSEYERGIVLNHAGPGTVTADYSHGYPIALKRELLEKWAEHVEGLVKPAGATEILR